MPEHRSPDPGVSRILLKAQELNRVRDQVHRRAVLRMLQLESTGTLMLGTASLALAVVMTIVTVLGLFGIPVRNWSQPRTWVIQTTPGAGTTASPGGPGSLAGGATSRKVWVPSDDCTLLGFLGLILGGAGIGLSLRRGKFSWLSAAGFVLILLMMLLVVSCGLAMNLMP
jgi:hypothetical protein